MSITEFDVSAEDNMLTEVDPSVLSNCPAEPPATMSSISVPGPPCMHLVLSVQ